MRVASVIFACGLAITGCGERAPAASAVAQTPASPATTPPTSMAEIDAFLRRVYASYPDDRSGDGADILTEQGRANVTDDLASAMRADRVRNPEGVGALEFDPIIQGQDWDRVRVLDVQSEPTGRDGATASVRFSNGDQISRTTFELRRTPAGWRIDDIGNGPALPSVKQLLRGGEAASGPLESTPASPIPSLRHGGSSSSDLAKAMQCRGRAQPTPLLTRLAGEQQISARPDEGADSVGCFFLRRAVAVTSRAGGAAVSVTAICAFDEDGFSDLRGAARDLYFRGPGTSPGQTLTFYVRNTEAEARAFLSGNGATGQAQLNRWSDSTLGFLPARPWHEISCEPVWPD